MRCGYFTMPLHPPGSSPSQTMADDLDQLVALERLGFEEAWIGEHFTSVWENVPSARTCSSPRRWRSPGR